MPVKRKYTKKTKFTVTPDIKKYAAITVFVFFWVLAIIADDKSTIWYYINEYLNILFWEYYKYIFHFITNLCSKEYEIESRYKNYV